MKKQNQLLITILILLLLLITTIQPILAHPNQIFQKQNQIPFNEEHLENRRFLWQTPNTPPPPTGYPILMLLHGASQYAESWFLNGTNTMKGSFIWGQKQTQFTAAALQQGFMVIAPDSTRPYFFGPKAWDSETPDLNTSADLQFIQNIITWLNTTNLSINHQHICCTGFSSGGFMTSRIGHALSTHFAAIAIHSGANADSYEITWKGPNFDTTSPQNFSSNYPPTLIIHGTKDALVPIAPAKKMYTELQRNNIRTHFLENPNGRHIWQTIFTKSILQWFSYGYNATSQPTQPPTGPGGSTYPHTSVNTTKHGRGGKAYWLYTPDDPQPTTAPVIVLNHGYLAINPSVYQAWINHLVKKGNIVIYPQYQQTILLGYKRFTDNAIYAVKQALTHLETHPIAADTTKFAITGHSLGGGITAYMAALAHKEGLPTPKAIMPVQPFLGYGGSAEFSDIANTTKMLVIFGQDDTVVPYTDALNIYYNTTNIPNENKQFIIQVTDTYGYPTISSDHGAPTCGINSSFLTTDAMDYYSTWKLFDALTDFAFYGTHENYCFGNTTEQRFMGQWSDGTPVAELIILDTP